MKSHTVAKESKEREAIYVSAVQMKDNHIEGMERLLNFRDGSYSKEIRELASKKLKSSSQFLYDKNGGLTKSSEPDTVILTSTTESQAKLILESILDPNRSLASRIRPLSMTNQAFGKSFEIYQLEQVEAWIKSGEPYNMLEQAKRNAEQ